MSYTNRNLSIKTSTTKSFPILKNQLPIDLKSFVSRLIPVFWDTNKKPFRSVTLKWWSTLTCPNDVIRVLDITSSGLFFPQKTLKINSGG